MSAETNDELCGSDLSDVSDISDGEDARGPIYDSSDDEDEDDEDELAAVPPEVTGLNGADEGEGELPDGPFDPEDTALRIQIASDLHIEFYENEAPPDSLIEPRAPVLALLGDVGLACTAQLREFLHRQAERFEHVLFLAGNHEYYNKGGKTAYCMDEQDEWMRNVCSEKENLHFMEKRSMVLNDVLILATTLWSEIPDERLWAAETFMNDYALSYNHSPGEEPRKLTASETRQFHRESVAWLRAQVAEAKREGRRVVVLTHHTPILTGTSHPKYEDSDLSCCFSSDLKGLLLCGGPPIAAWACGHTHHNFDFTVGSVRVLSNQRGYPGSPKKGYDPRGIVLKVNANGS